MTYTTLLESFKQELRNACRSYEETFAQKAKLVPEERARDILALEHIWGAEENHAILKEESIRICTAFKTGWFGRSELRKKVMAVVTNPTYSDGHFFQALKEENEDLRLKISTQSFVISAAASIDGVPDLTRIKAQVDSLLMENSKLKKDNAELRQENSDLKLLILGIKQANEKLASQVQNLHVRLLAMEERGSSKVDSPSSSVVSSFSVLASS